MISCIDSIHINLAITKVREHHSTASILWSHYNYFTVHVPAKILHDIITPCLLNELFHTIKMEVI